MARVAELEDAAEQARSRAAKLEKDKIRLQMEVRDLTLQLETVRVILGSEGSPRSFSSHTIIIITNLYRIKLPYSTYSTL